MVSEEGTLEEITAFSNSKDASQQLTQRTVNSTTFIFMRSSAQGDSTPLISTLSIDSVSIDLNGTAVHCMEAENSMMSDLTTIQIVDISQSEFGS